MAETKRKSQIANHKNRAQNLKLPHILRRITAIVSWKTLLLLLVASLFALNVAQIGQNLYSRYQYAQEKNLEKQVLEAQMQQWQELVRRRPNYRDGYFKLAVLAFELNRIGEAKTYLAKVFELDPNFEPARELEKILYKK